MPGVSSLGDAVAGGLSALNLGIAGIAMGRKMVGQKDVGVDGFFCGPLRLRVLCVSCAWFLNAEDAETQRAAEKGGWRADSW